ncbi:hypothetical protein NsoK4_08820 [Nitrosopumilus sp. K4]|uniref:tetratricopeptide repeat protein n=1 Tax=Nitrosopumilus sp. K4 TaxID=2795383 RepID=UPI001BA489DA|nr:hypothetical protein [Nitrosopumilus sp. K4]QUC64509.1 hypothetical protein NsoK4_08820 [Nitrosopumilus sp. K4]
MKNFKLLFNNLIHKYLRDFALKRLGTHEADLLPIRNFLEFSLPKWQENNRSFSRILNSKKYYSDKIIKDMLNRLAIIVFILFLIPIFSTNVFSEDVNELIKIAKEFENDDKNNDAMVYFDKVLDIEPDNIEALNGKSRILLFEKKFDVSREFAEKALEIDNKNLSALVNIGIGLGFQNYFDDSQKYFDRALEIDGNHTDALVNKATLLIKQKKEYQLSAELLEKALDIDPDNVYALQNLRLAFHEMPTKRFDGIIQTVMRDKDGNLIGYSESDRITITEYVPRDFFTAIGLNSTMKVDENIDSIILVKEGNRRFLQEYKEFITRTGEGMFYLSSHDIGNATLNVLNARTHGHFQEPEDKISSRWILVVPKSFMSK